MMQPRESVPESISGIFFAHAAATPEKIALACEGREISYATLAQLVARWSNALAANGVRRGDQIGVILPNNVEFVALILVAADLGAGLVPLSPALPPAVALHSLQAAQARHLVSTSPQLAALHAEPGSDAVHGCWLSIDAAGAGTITLEQLLQAAPADARPLYAGRADDALILTMTSGSTGSPKPIVLTQRTKLNRLRAAVQLYGITAQERTLAATPL